MVASCKFQRQLKPSNKDVRKTNGKLQVESQKVFKMLISFFEDEINNLSWHKVVNYYVNTSVHHGVIKLPNESDVDKLIELYEKMDNQLHQYIETGIFTPFI